MRIRILLASLAVAGLSGCAHDTVSGHNYAGSPGSTYDAALNPPQAHGVATYDAASPIVPHDYGNGGDSAPAR